MTKEGKGKKKQSNRDMLRPLHEAHAPNMGYVQTNKGKVQGKLVAQPRDAQIQAKQPAMQHHRSARPLHLCSLAHVLPGAFRPPGRASCDVTPPSLASHASLLLKAIEGAGTLGK
ncbi:hypothetical protein U1Q18_036401 [Sarracenia purpurea var. burkii]